MVETLDHDAQYLKDGISNCLVLCHILVLKQLVAVVGNQATSHKMSQVNCVQHQLHEKLAVNKSNLQLPPLLNL